MKRVWGNFGVVERSRRGSKSQRRPTLALIKNASRSKSKTSAGPVFCTLYSLTGLKPDGLLSEAYIDKPQDTVKTNVLTLVLTLVPS